MNQIISELIAGMKSAVEASDVSIVKARCPGSELQKGRRRSDGKIGYRIRLKTAVGFIGCKPFPTPEEAWADAKTFVEKVMS